jgi:outer membrane receptor protein involved in Fe transport
LRLLSILLLAAIAAPAQAAPAQVRGSVRNTHGHPVSGATIDDMAGRRLAVSGPDGQFMLSAPPSRMEVVATHYVPSVVTITRGRAIRVVLHRPLETVVVTAYRSPLGSLSSPVSTRVLSRRQMRHSAAITLDGKLTEIPGFQLYRRSSSLVANPTTEGVSLRGLGSTAASRTLVTLDGIPMNDPFGGWIHWEELPSLAIRSVEIVRGGASDIYGSSAIGGVINIIPVRPHGDGLQLVTSGGSESTLDDSLLGTLSHGHWSGLAAGGVLATDGYTMVEPSQRGPVDQPSNIHAQNALVEADRALPRSGRLFVRADALNESRHNGTPDQWNATRLWRAAGGVNQGPFVFRLYGTGEHYRQTFASVSPSRTSEKMVKFQFDTADQTGAALRWHRAEGQHAVVLAGADTETTHATDDEHLLVYSRTRTNTSAHQRQTGVWGEFLFTPPKWTLSASARVDHFSNFNARQFTNSALAPLPSWSQTVFDPRLGIVRRITPSLSLSASGFRAFRAPTMNELYRSFQVGDETTKANPNLRAERATGWETGIEKAIRPWGTTIRASYFWTQVNRPISSLTLLSTPTKVIYQRENLGQIESRGVSLDFASQPAPWIGLEGGYQYAYATVAKAAREPQLVGKWIPEVPRNMASAQLRLSRPRLGLISFQGNMSGREYDNDLNTFLLHGYFRLDAHAQHSFGRHTILFADGENLFDRAIQVGMTPLVTLGTPRTMRVGLRFTFGD